MSEIDNEDRRPAYEPPVQGVVPATSQAPIDGLYWQSWKRNTHDPRDCPLQANLGLFFDGTGNNEKQNRDEFKHTNIVRLHDAYRYRPVEGSFRTYIPGVGTPFPEIGEMEASPKFGGGMGYGGEERILYGLLAVFNVIHQRAYGEKHLFLNEDVIKALCRSGPVPYKEDESSLYGVGLGRGFQTTIIEDRTTVRRNLFRILSALLQTKLEHAPSKPVELAIDVFGFSRGATQARVFCTWLQAMLNAQGELAGVLIRLRFLGIFDTVASVGKGVVLNSDETDGHDNWAEVADVRIAALVENCVHFVAMHEPRKNFPLDLVSTPVNPKTRLVQCAYPGSHSDVGGGYRPRELGIIGDATADELKLEHPAHWQALDAMKLSQVPLNHMLECAMRCQVAVDRQLAVRQLSETIRDDPFTIAPRLQQAYDSFLQLQGTRARPVWEWHLPYLRWRWEWRMHYEDLSQVAYASPDERKWLLAANQKLVYDTGRLKHFGKTDIAAREAFRRRVLHWSRAKTHDQEQNDEQLKGLDREAEGVLAEVENAVESPSALSRFFGRYVHDSYAGFWPSVPEITGYWRCRKGFYGSKDATIVQRHKDGQQVA